MITKNFKERLTTSLLLIFLTILIFNYKFLFVYTLIILGILSIIEFFNLNKRIFKKNISIFILNFFFIFYVFIFCLIISIFYNYFHLKIILFSILLCCIASDIGGYFVGKILKGPKISKISPNKTISGSIGSIFFSCIFLSFFYFYLLNKIHLEYFIIGTLTSIFCQIGDLLFSLMKRKANLKDTSNYLPGHGGILDRIDGILLGLPFGILSIIIFLP